MQFMWLFAGYFLRIHHPLILIITEYGTPDGAGTRHRHNGGFHAELRAATSPFREEEAKVHGFSSAKKTLLVLCTYQVSMGARISCDTNQ